jgi:hypothetical protein
MSTFGSLRAAAGLGKQYVSSVVHLVERLENGMCNYIGTAKPAMSGSPTISGTNWRRSPDEKEMTKTTHMEGLLRENSSNARE